MKQNIDRELQEETDTSSKIEGGFYGLPLKVFRSSRQQFCKDTENVNEPVTKGSVTGWCPPQSPHVHKWHQKTMRHPSHKARSKEAVRLGVRPHCWGTMRLGLRSTACTHVHMCMHARIIGIHCKVLKIIMRVLKYLELH